MKAFTTILLTLLVLGGCASTLLDGEKEIKTYKGLVYQSSFISNEHIFILSVRNKIYECGTGSCGFLTEKELLPLAKEICEIENKGKYAQVKSSILNIYEDFTFKCLTEEENKVRQGKIIADAYKKVQERENTRALMEEMQIAEEKKEMLEKLEIKKEKCRTYGFKDETDGMGMCLIELDKLAEIEKQTKSIEANSIAQAEAIAQQEAKEKNRREAQALINLGNALSGKGKASCSFKCSGGQVVQGSCQKVTVSVGSQTCWKQ